MFTERKMPVTVYRDGLDAQPEGGRMKEAAGRSRATREVIDQ
jgi:hypothetical protein